MREDRLLSPARSRGLIAGWLAVALVASCGPPASPSLEAPTTSPSSSMASAPAETALPVFTTRTGRSGATLFIENRAGADVLRLGLDTTLGAAVSELSLNGRDLVAKAGYGSHLIAIGLYDGDGTYDSCNGCTGVTGWNPTESCDYYRHGSPILEEALAAQSLYVKSRAVEWRPDDKGGGPGKPVPSDIVIEKWITPAPGHPYMFQERYRLTHDGADQHANASNAIASYEINADLGAWVFYAGGAPGTAGALTTLPQASLPQWPAATAVQWLPEAWAGWADPSGFGFAAYAPQGFPYATASQATGSPTDRVSVFSFLTPYSFRPGTTIDFTTFLMVGPMSRLQRETYAIARDLGPFADTSPPVGDINLDAPLRNATVSGEVAVEGYAFDSGLGGVVLRLLLDGREVAKTTPNIRRPDIRLSFAGAPSNPAFHFDLDTTTASNGRHVVQVSATDAAGNVGLFTRRVLTFAN